MPMLLFRCLQILLISLFGGKRHSYLGIQCKYSFPLNAYNFYLDFVHTEMAALNLVLEISHAYNNKDAYAY